MSEFKPTAFRVEQKGERMVAIYATVDGEEVFVGSSLNGGGYDAKDKVAWMLNALEAHYGADMNTTAKPKKKAGPSKAIKKPLVKKARK